MKDVGDRRRGRAKQLDEEIGGVQAALMSGPEHRGEHLLGLCAAGGAVAAATHLPGDDGGAEGLFGAPIGGIERRIKEEAEDRVKLDDEMRLKPLHLHVSTRRAREQAAEPLDQLPTRGGEAVGGDRAALIARPRGEGGLKDRFDRGDKRLLRIVEQQDPAAAQQMRETRLMQRRVELAIRLPAVALQDAGVVAADDRGGLREAATGLNRIDGGRRGDKRPEPLQVGGHAPAGFIRRHHRTAAYGRTERGITRLRLARRPMHGMRDAAAGDAEPEAIVQELGDFPVGEAELFVEDHRQRDGLWPELHRGRPKRVRGLQRMPPLHAPVAVATGAHVDAKVAHDRPLHREVFVKLRRDACPADRTRTVRTAGGQWHVVGLIDVPGSPPIGAPPIRGPWFAPRTSRRVRGHAARERCRLAIHRAARRLEVVFQFLVFTPQPLTLGFRPPKIFTEPLDLARLVLDDLLRVTGTISRSAIRHADVMPEPRLKYKYGILDSQR